MRITSILLLFFLLQPYPPSGGKTTDTPVDANQLCTTAAPDPILTGADQMELYLPLLRGKSVAVFANPTSVVGTTHLVDTLLKKGIRVSKIFSPEHGFRGEADAGAKVGNQQDPQTGIPIVSLYGAKNKPTPADLEGVDILLFDIQDVGVRFYTYISSLQKYMEAAIENHRPLVILDRPDPNGFYVDGPILDTKFRSFVGMQPIPVVYGMTIGEYPQKQICFTGKTLPQPAQYAVRLSLSLPLSLRRNTR